MANVAVFLVVHDVNKLQDLLAAWEEAGVTGATVMESTGLHRLRMRGYRDDLPLIPSIDSFLRGAGEAQRTCFTLIPEEKVDGLVEVTEAVLGKLADPNTGILFVLPVLRVVGLQPKRWEEREE